MSGMGMEQTEARQRARELGGTAVSARNPDRCVRWRLGGYPRADDVWIVISLDRQVVLDDGDDQNYSLKQADPRDRYACRGCSGTCCTGVNDEPCTCEPLDDDEGGE